MRLGRHTVATGPGRRLIRLAKGEAMTLFHLMLDQQPARPRRSAGVGRSE